jgi:hypothetical protein
MKLFSWYLDSKIGRKYRADLEETPNGMHKLKLYDITDGEIEFWEHDNMELCRDNEPHIITYAVRDWEESITKETPLALGEDYRNIRSSGSPQR